MSAETKHFVSEYRREGWGTALTPTGRTLPASGAGEAVTNPVLPQGLLAFLEFCTLRISFSLKMRITIPVCPGRKRKAK